MYSDYLKGGEQWISLTGFSSTLKYCSQKPPGTVSEIKKLKNFLGEHALRPPTFRKSMSSITFIANEKAFKVLIYCRAANFCVRFIYTTYESQVQVT